MMKPTVVGKHSMKMARIESRDIPTFDISTMSELHTVIARGDREYQGHPTTVLMPDGNTVFCVWTIGHGGPCGPLKKSLDRGKSWSELLPVPDNWTRFKNCPSIWNIPTGGYPERLVVYAQDAQSLVMNVSVSLENGENWTPMTPCGDIVSVMPWTTLHQTGPGRLIALTSARRPGDPDKWSNNIIQSESSDRGLTWRRPEIVADIEGVRIAEPWLLPSPDGNELACLLRNNSSGSSKIMFADNLGSSWSRTVDLPEPLWGHRHVARYLPDGRVIIVFRDVSTNEKTYGHFCAWIGSYDDLKYQRKGGTKIKLLHHYPIEGNWKLDCGYPGVEVFDDGTVLATTYLHYREEDPFNSVVCLTLDPEAMEI